MYQLFFKLMIILTGWMMTSGLVYAQNNDSKVQDMSDPLAVYTQAGIGYTDKGLNLKIGKSYDTGEPTVMAMYILELKGILGDRTGYRSAQVDSIDSLRFRNFNVDTTDGRGLQVDINWNFNSDTGSASYSLIQALPKFGNFQFYPLAGMGLSVANNVDANKTGWADDASPSGISIPGAFIVLGTYSRITLTEDIWLNYNPLWLSSVAGSENYTRNTFAFGESNIFLHEAAASYQITPRLNVRYFANWSDIVSFTDGGHRIEVNYQF